MARAIILMMDSLGIGGAPDAAKFGDTGANTLAHIAAACANGDGDRDGLRQGRLDLPNLARLGMGLAVKGSDGVIPEGMDAENAGSAGCYGHANERSFGKDTPSGHWELAGVPVLFDWGHFPRQEPCFPDALTAELIDKCSLPGVLGNKHASGTEIIAEFGDEHLASGKPIIYTSADSVFQIAAHEKSFGLDRLYEVCLIARKLVDSYEIGRVIARPFVGGAPDDFRRTGNRRDYAVPPPASTLLDHLVADGGRVVAIGKIADIYAHQGISETVKADGNEALFDATLAAVHSAPDRSLIFPNFVDFDQLYGHRRDVPGYAAALEAFDRRLPELEAALKPGDRVIITADHGCDPTWPGSDHTRENVPVLAFGPGLKSSCIGARKSFADIGQSLAGHLGMKPLAAGESFL